MTRKATLARKEKKIHLLNLDFEPMCGLPKSVPTTIHMREATCQACLDKLHPDLRAKLDAERSKR